ncbi:MAG: amidase [Rhodobacteraceae bacterium]|nr:amidase [Paracoccaceae bacterium]
MPKHQSTTFSGHELSALQAHEVVDLLKRREVAPQDLLNIAFERIAQVEGAVNAMPTTCPERAANMAANLSDEARDHPGWLAGLPVGIKDLTPVAGVRTTWGTRALADFVPEASDPLVLRLEDRGAIVVGKTNTPEFGAGGNTFNDVFGKTRNPYDTRLNAAGSSGGAAVSLATGEVWLSHGSDHGGSLRTPAAYNGIVGLRPSPGIAASDSESGFMIEGQQGPMARSVRDCALFLDAMAGWQPRLPASYPPPDRPYQQAVIEADGKVRIAFAPDLNGFSPVEPEIDQHLRAALAAVEQNGGMVDEACPDLPALERTYHSLRGLLWAAAFRRAPESLTRHFKPTLAGNLAFGRSLTMDDMADAELDRTVIFRNMVDFLQDFDVLACPTVGNMPRPVDVEWVDQVNNVRFPGYMDWLRFAFLATTAGLPAISVPVGLSQGGIPVGIQLIGKPRGEARLLAVARAVELAVGGPFGPIDPNVTHI